MGRYTVTYKLPNEEHYTKEEVKAFNVLHAEKLIKQKYGKEVYVYMVVSN